MQPARASGSGDRLRGGLTYGVAFLSGNLAWLGFAGMDLWPLALVAYVPMLAVLDHARRRGWRSVIGHAAVFGIVAWTGGYHWIFGTFERFSGLPIAVSLLLASVFWLAQAGHAVLWAVLWVALRRRGWGSALATVVAFGVAELLYPQMFPSWYGASLHMVLPLLQLAELGGPILLSLLCIAANGALYELLAGIHAGRRRAWVAPVVVAAVFAASLVYGFVRLAQIDARIREAGTLHVGLVQADLPVEQKRDRPESSHRRHGELSTALLREGPVDLLIWPETAYALVLPAPVESVRPRIGRAFPAPLLFGATVQEGRGTESKRYNAALLAGANGRVLGRYDKQRLVPFTERVPDLLAGIPAVASQDADLSPGEVREALVVRDVRISVLICYEDVLTGHVRQVVADERPDLLVNLTNDAWFGETTEPRIHAALARFRAVEHRRSLVRATNSGETVVFDPAGRILAAARPFEPATLRAVVPLLRAPPAPYAHLGDWVGWVCVGAALLMLLRRRGRTPGS